MMGPILLVVFPFTYFTSYLYALRGVAKGDYFALFPYFIFGLPIYITSLSILHLNRLDVLIPLFQYSKELLIVLTVAFIIYQLKESPNWGWLDRLVVLYFIYTGLFVLFPIGSFDFMNRIIAFKNISFFPLLYFIGRLVNVSSYELSKFQKQVMLMSILAMTVLLGEILMYTHFQTITGYTSFYEKYFSFDPTGNYGLNWTFEISGGVKRFASFFANPLEHAASTLITLAVLSTLLVNLSLLTEQKLFFGTLLSSLLSILFALSRASLAGYFLASYLIFKLMNKKKVLFFYHAVIIVLVILILIFAFDSTVTEFIFDTLQFNDSSSLAHLVEWIDGVEAIVTHPIGIGLGESGRVAGELGLNTGGENQLIILGVQCGLPAIILYLLILGFAIYQSAYLVRHTSGTAATLGIIVFVIKIGLVVPLLTSSAESYLYVSYVGWFFTGLMSSAYSTTHNVQPALLKGPNSK
ncbi:MAG: hypothetical protein EBQ65_00275 [Chitinophagaceae bacterium]|nr:hypothetical protein [Chitinophagaceae bacterium]